MGQAHLGCYQQLAGQAEVIAVADIRPERAAGQLGGAAENLATGEKKTLDMSRVKGTADYRELLAMPEVDLVDVCVPTPLHAEIAIAAIESGKHVLCEKPLARTSAEARRIARAASKAKGFFMPAMCMRFWPQWKWLRDTIAAKTYGRTLSAHFTRLSSPPPGWFQDGKQSGGAALDLHVHDADFVRYCFGEPRALHSHGYVGVGGEVDHLLTQFDYPDVPLVAAEGGWSLSEGFSFRMRYLAHFERATADFDIERKDPLLLHQDGKSTPIDCGPTDGWIEEIRYYLQCIAAGQRPTVVTAEDGARSVALVEAEVQSIAEGRTIAF